MQNNGKDMYFVAVKVFLEDGDGNFLITKDTFNTTWDIPGGRLRPEDFDVDLSDVVARKMREELGEDVTYDLREPVVYMRHEREEQFPDGTTDTRRIFAIGYRATYIGGEMKMGKNHEDYKWVSKADFKPEEYFDGGWLKGVKEYMSKK